CLCKESGKRESGIYQLSVPTGGGKTLSSLRYALEHARKYNKDRIFYIIPFITITEQNAKEIKDILGREDIVLEHHSNVVIDNNDEDYKLLTERWESPIIFTTMVQFMNTLFEGGTQSIRRLHNLANSVIIFDEIQTLPIKSVHLFNNAINFLSYICNASVVLCTATQPLLEITDKPVKLCENPNIVPDIYKRFEQFKRVELKDKTINGGYSIDLLKDFITEKSESSKSILVIVNTKSVARNLFERLNKIMDTIEKGKKCTLFHLSTNMCPINRLDVLKKMKEKLGKERLICVSTQLVEAGVNISFECVIRSLAGMDSLSQAAGRCNRHGESSCKEAYIVNINEENIDKLLDIKTGQDKTLRVLYEFKENPAHFEYDLLSQKTMDTYYKYYFHERKPEMDYCLAGEYKGKALYDILAANDVGREAYYGRNGRNPEAILRQAFKTAGRSFSFIDQNTTAILVPYGKGKELITKLNGVCSLSDLKVCLREAQHYIVNLYDTDRRKLEKINAITKLANGDILALKESFYDEEIGISFEKLPMEFYEY
ncbi:MAG: CRISPR-associated helicase Cas3', partial [Bacillota bacterium]